LIGSIFNYRLSELFCANIPDTAFLKLS